MTVRQLQNVFSVKDSQRVRIHDRKNSRTIETVYGWVLEPDYDYDGFNYQEVERILSLQVHGAEFRGDWLILFTH